MNPSFDHEKLRVCQKLICLMAWVNEILETIPKFFSAHNQLDRATTSIPLNFAQGKGKFTVEKTTEGKEIISPIVSILVGLIKRTSPDRAYEERAEYGGSITSRLRLRLRL